VFPEEISPRGLDQAIDPDSFGWVQPSHIIPQNVIRRLRADSRQSKPFISNLFVSLIHNMHAPGPFTSRFNTQILGLCRALLPTLISSHGVPDGELIVQGQSRLLIGCLQRRDLIKRGYDK
jgi:hypothetical protein